MANRFEAMFADIAKSDEVGKQKKTGKKGGAIDFKSIMATDNSFADAMRAVSDTLSEEHSVEGATVAPPEVHPTVHPIEQPTDQPTNAPIKSPIQQPVGAPVLHPETPPNSQQTSLYAIPTTKGTSDNTTIKPTFPPTVPPQAQPETRQDNHPLRQPVGQPIQHPMDVFISSLANASDGTHAALAVSKSAGRILIYLAQQNGISKRKHIMDVLQMPEGTVKDALNQLNKIGILTTERYMSPGFNGFIYTISDSLFNDFVRIRGWEFSELLNSSPATYRQASYNHFKKPYHQPMKHPMQSPAVQQPQQPISSYSSSVKQKTTTSENQILTGPEMSYWAELGLQEKQTLKWCEEFSLSPDELRQQLAWARWDILENEKKADEPINWFYGALKRSAGCYPQAKGYKTPAMIRAASMKAQLDEEEAALKELADAERDARFRAVLADPAGAAYQTLFASLDSFAQSLDGKSLEASLRAAFVKREEG